MNLTTDDDALDVFRRLKRFEAEFIEATVQNPLSMPERILYDGERPMVGFELRVPFNGGVYLNHIRAYSRGRGDGSKGLEWLLALARKHNICISGVVWPEKGAAMGRVALRQWYQRHGFDVTFGGDKPRIFFNPQRKV